MMMNDADTRPASSKAREFSVYLRYRPVSDGDLHSGGEGYLTSENENDNDIQDHYDSIFNEIFQTKATQANVYDKVVAPLVPDFLSGQNCCILAYGENSSGKTYSLMGDVKSPLMSFSNKNGGFDKGIPSSSSLGILPRLAKDIFHTIKKQKMEQMKKRHRDPQKNLHDDIEFRCSSTMIYREKIVDLLVDRDYEECSTSYKKKDRLKFLKLKDHESKGGVYVDGSVEILCNSENDLYRAMMRGVHNEDLLASLFNADPSRSHSIFTIKMLASWPQKKTISRFHLVNIADSNKQKDLLKSSPSDNCSQGQLVLSKIMSRLSKKSNDLSSDICKDSKLTWMINEAFFDECITSILLCERPCWDTEIDGISPTIKFGIQCKRARKCRRRTNSLKDEIHKSSRYKEINTICPTDKLKSIITIMKSTTEKVEKKLSTFAAQQSGTYHDPNFTKAIESGLHDVIKLLKSFRTDKDDKRHMYDSPNPKFEENEEADRIDVESLKESILDRMHTDISEIPEEEEAIVDVRKMDVFLRLRPMNTLEMSMRCIDCFELETDENFLIDSPLEGEHKFSYDHVFDCNTTQADMYNRIGLNITSDLLGGINHCVFTCGLASSGKSYSLFGILPPSERQQKNEYGFSHAEWEQAGLFPRLVRDLFAGMSDSPLTSEYTVRCSFVAISMEKIWDLLTEQMHHNQCVYLTEGEKGIEIDQVYEPFCFEENDVFALFNRGTARYSALSEHMAIDDQCSHLVLTLKIEQTNLATKEMTYSQLQVVRAGDVERKVKGIPTEEKIVHNSSSNLKDVLKLIVMKKDDVPYENSKLTHLLKDAFGGNCITTMLITASPSNYQISESINIVKLGQLARNVFNYPKLNRDYTIDVYQKCLKKMTSKHSELILFLKKLIQELSTTADETSKGDIRYDLNQQLTNSMWKTISDVFDEAKTVSYPANIEEDRIDENEKDTLSRMLYSHLVECCDETDALEEHLSTILDLQTEVTLYKWKNEFLSNEKSIHLTEISSMKHTLEKQEVKLGILQNSIKELQFQKEKMIVFLRRIRSLCWAIQRCNQRSRIVDMSEIISGLDEEPDLRALVDFDKLLLQDGILGQMEGKKDTDCRLQGEGQISKLREDLLLMTNKCIELQVILSKEKAVNDALLNKSGSFDIQRLGKTITLLYDDINSKNQSFDLATWKLLELDEVNKSLSEQLSTEGNCTKAIQDSLKDLQDTHQRKTMEWTKKDAKSKQKIKDLQKKIDSLTISGDNSEEVLLSRSRMNLLIRGEQAV